MVILLFALLVPLVWAIYRAFTPWYSIPIPGIPLVSPRPGPLGDLVPTLRAYIRTKTFHPYYEALARKHGKVYQYFFLRKPVIVVSDIHEIEDILGRRHPEFDRARTTTKVFSCMAPKGMLALPTGEMWKRHVRLFGPSMTNQNLRRITPAMTDLVSQLLALWELKSKHLGSLSAKDQPGGCIDAAKDIDFLVVDIISRVAFGESYRQLEHTNALFTLEDVPSLLTPTPIRPTRFPCKMSPLAKASKLFFDSIPAVSPSPDKVHRLYSFLSPAYRNGQKTLHSFVDHQIADARARAKAGEGGRSLLDSVVEKELKEDDQLDDDEIRDEVMNFLIAGEETTASTIRWLVRYLADAPHVQRKLRSEISEVLPGFGTREPTFDEVHAMDAPYLEATLAELLRLSSTVSVSYRSTLVPTTILSHPVPAKTEILLLLGLLGRTSAEDEPGGWKTDPEVFEPERWLDEGGRFDAKAGPSYPFSLGQRGCFGSRLATLELKLFLVQLTAAFFLDSVPALLRDGRTRETITRRPEQCFVRLRKWEES